MQFSSRIVLSVGIAFIAASISSTATLAEPLVKTSEPVLTSGFGWREATINDLQSAYALLKWNHPGSVDPDDDEFKEWLEAGYIEGLKAAESAKTTADYDRILRRYIRGFAEDHVQFVMQVTVF